ncbi:MAG: cupin domain-containing protein [Pyrinomonadaceae bacterium]
MQARFLKLYNDGSRESHFADLELQLLPTEFAPQTSRLYLSEQLGSGNCFFFGAPAGWIADWHGSSGRHLFVVLTGMWEVKASDGESRTFATGDVLLVEDTVGKGHASRVYGDNGSVAMLVDLA